MMNKRIITNKLICEFKLYLYEQERSKNTIEKYLRDVRCFAKNAGRTQLNKQAILEYKQYLCKKYSPRSVNSILSSMNTFFEFAGWHELKVKTLKIQRQIFSDRKSELTKSEYEQLLQAAKSRKNERLFYLMQTVAGTGVRVSEIRCITVEAVKTGVAVIDCKGKIRQVLLPGKLCRMLKKYIDSNNIKSGAVFISKNGRPLDRTNIWRMMKNLCKAAGVSEKKVFPHNFRHLFARTYYSLQKDIVRLADILGHSNINTTRIYTAETGDIHRKQLEQLGLLTC